MGAVDVPMTIAIFYYLVVTGAGVYVFRQECDVQAVVFSIQIRDGHFEWSVTVCSPYLWFNFALHFGENVPKFLQTQITG